MHLEGENLLKQFGQFELQMSWQGKNCKNKQQRSSSPLGIGSCRGEIDAISMSLKTQEETEPRVAILNLMLVYLDLSISAHLMAYESALRSRICAADCIDGWKGWTAFW